MLTVSILILAAGALLSVGLLRAISLEAVEECITEHGKSTGRPSSHLYWIEFRQIINLYFPCLHGTVLTVSSKTGVQLIWQNSVPLVKVFLS